MKASVPDLLYFAIAGGVALGAAIGVVVSKNAVHAALYLALSLFGVAALFLAESAPFLAAVQLIVYAGAVVVLFLFVIMLLGVDKREDTSEKLAGQRFGGIAASLGFAVVAVLVAGSIGAITSIESPPGPGLAAGNVEQLAKVLFTDYLYAFELTAAPLIVAAIAAIVLAKREMAPSVAEAADAADSEESDTEDSGESGRAT